MEKVKNGIIFTLALIVAYDRGRATAAKAFMRTFADGREEIPKRREYRSYRDY